MSLLDKLGINKTEFEKIEAESVPEGYLMPSGVYDAAVDVAYIRKTDSGAKMLEVGFLLTVGSETKPYHWATAIQSGKRAA